MTVVAQDLFYALRALAHRPMYAAITILVLAIAIGANTTVFSVLNGLFLRPLPYAEGDRLVMVYDSYTKIGNLGNAGTAIPDYLERREQAKSLESLAITAGAARTLGGEGEPLRLCHDARVGVVVHGAPCRASDRPRVHGRRGDTGQRPRRRPQRQALARSLRRERERRWAATFCSTATRSA